MKKNVYKYILFLCCLLNCNSKLDEKYYEKFDISLINKSTDLKASGDIKAFLDVQEKYLIQAQKNGYNEGKAICYINLALISYAKADSHKKLFLLEQAEKELKNSKNPVHLSILYNGYTTYYLNMNMYEIAYDNSNKAFNELKKIKNNKLKNILSASAFLKRSGIFYGKSQYDSAFFYMYKSNGIKRTALTEGFLADYHIEQKKFDSAYVHINRALSIIENDKSTTMVHFRTYLILGKYNFMLKQYTAAEEAYKKAFKTKYLVKGVFGVDDPSLSKALAALYKATGNEEKANYYSCKFKAENDIVGKYRNENINPAIDRFLADIKNERNACRNKRRTVIGIMVLLSLIVGRYGYWKIKQMNNMKCRLEKKAEDLKKEIADERYSELIKMAKNNDRHFLPKFQELYPGFIEKLLEINPELGISELLLAAFIKIHFTSKEIAIYTSIKLESVQQKKRRLRKKLGTPSEIDLYNFFDELMTNKNI